MSRRLYAASAVVAGAACAAAPFVARTPGVLSGEWYARLLLVVPLVFAVVAVGVGRELWSAYPEYGRIGTAGVALAPLLLMPLLARGVVGQYTLGPGLAAVGLAWVGVITLELATVAVAVAAWRTGVPSRWTAVWLPLAVPAGLFGYHVAGALGVSVGTGRHLGAAGLVWVVLGYHRWRGRTGQAATTTTASGR